jgi:hypothetical protein
VLKTALNVFNTTRRKVAGIFESFGIIARGSSFKDFVPSCQRELCNFNQLGAFGSDS